MSPVTAAWHDRCDGIRQRQRATRGDAVMIDLDMKCRRCGKPMTLRVRGEQARKLFLKDGALCETCHTLGGHVEPVPAQGATEPAGPTHARACARPISFLEKDPESA
jgi:hypothetical protein